MFRCAKILADDRALPQECISQSKMLRIDRAIRPQGLIKSARFFSIILNEKGLYLLNVAPAPGMVAKPKNAVESMAVNYALKRIDKKLEEGETVLASMSIDEFARRKGSFFFPRSEVADVQIDKKLRRIA